MTRDAVEVIVCYAKCWACTFGHCPGGWHTWADSEDIEHAESTGQPDPSTSKCGCACTDTAVVEPEDDEDPLAFELESLDATPCPECEAIGPCAFDADGRPLIHAIGDES